MGEEISGKLARDKAYFKRLVDRYGAELRVFCFRLTGGRNAVADDILQETYQAVWEARDRFRDVNERAFLYQIARRKAIDVFRKESKDPVCPPSLDTLISQATCEEDGEESLAPRVRREELLRCFERLDPVETTIVQTCFGLRRPAWADEDEPRLTYREIGLLLEDEGKGRFQEDTVRMIRKRALNKLRRCLSSRRERIKHAPTGENPARAGLGPRSESDSTK